MTHPKRALVVLFAAGVVGGLVPSTAQASYGPSWCNASSCSLWSSASTQYHITEMPRGAGIKMICWRDGGWWNGTNRWFKSQTAYGSGFINANQVSNQTVVPRC